MASQQMNRAGASKARTLVREAIARGELSPPSAYPCVDCGQPARQYDHRDYNYPLAVDPVCCACNQHRGEGAGAEGRMQHIAGNGVGFVLTKGHGISRVKFRYVDFGLYGDEPDLAEADQCSAVSADPTVDFSRLNSHGLKHGQPSPATPLN